MSPTAAKDHAHQLIDKMAPSQVSVVVDLLEDLLDPLTLKLANAPIDDEPTTDADRAAVVRSYGAQMVSTEDLLAGFGLTLDDFHRMAVESSGPSI